MEGNTAAVLRACCSPLSAPHLRAALTIHSQCRAWLPHEFDLHLLAHGNALAGFELGAFVPIMLRSPGKLGGVSRPDLQCECCAALMLTSVAAAGAGLDLEAAAASSRGLLRSPSRLSVRQGCWNGPWAEGAASSRLQAAMAAPCGRISKSRPAGGLRWNRMRLCAEARRRGQAVRRSGKSRTDVWSWGEQLGRAGGRSIARDMRAPPRSVGARSVLQSVLTGLHVHGVCMHTVDLYRSRPG